MPEPVKVNVVSYGGVKPGQIVAGNAKEGGKATLFDAATSTDGSYALLRASGLTSWNVDMPNLEVADQMFYACPDLISFSADMPELTAGATMFRGCSKLATFSGDLPKLADGSQMFWGCSSLATFSSQLGSDEHPFTNGTYMFNACYSLYTFSSDLPYLTTGAYMFYNCTLSAESVKNVLSTIPDRAAAGLEVATLSIGKRTHFKTNPDVKALLGETGAEITAKTYSFKGWNVEVQN